MPKQAQGYIAGVIAGGALVLSASLSNGFHVSSPVMFSVYLALAVLASLCKMRLPGMEGTYSLNALFILFGIYYLSPLETMAGGCAAIVAQSCWRAKKRPAPVQVIFNLGNIVLSIGAAFLLISGVGLPAAGAPRAALLAAAAFVQFAVNTLLVSGVLSLLQGKALRAVWENWYQWSFPYYLIGATLVGLLPVGGRMAPPEAGLLLLPLFYLVHFFYGLSAARRAAPAVAEPGGPPAGLPGAARVYAGAVLGAGGALLGWALVSFDAGASGRFLGCLALGVLVSTWKVRLPGLDATVSVGFVVTLFAIAELPLSQTLLLSAMLCAVQVLWRPRSRASVLQTLFSVAGLVVSTALAYAVVRGGMLPGEWTRSVPAMLTIATALLFLANTMLVSTIVALAAAQPLSGIWQACSFWSFPYYLVGACPAALMVLTARSTGWPLSVLVLPLMGMVYVSYRRHVGSAAVQTLAESHG